MIEKITTYTIVLLISSLFFGIFFAAPTFAISIPELATKSDSVIDVYNNANPMYFQPGYDVDGDGQVDTLNSLDQKYANLSPQARAEWRARLFCQPKPSPSISDPNVWSEWRFCMAPSHLILHWYHDFAYKKNGSQEDLNRSTDHYYMLSVHTDALTTGTNEPNLAQFPDDPTHSYKLRDTPYSIQFLGDAAGYFVGLGWPISNGRVPREYCTAIETPHDPGRNCKTIRLWERTQHTLSATATYLGSIWLINSNGTLRTQYWDDQSYWDPSTWIELPNGWINPGYVNDQWNPSNQIGWRDLNNRRTMPVVTNPVSMTPYYFFREISGMTLSAKALLNYGGVYPKMHDFGIESLNMFSAFDSNNHRGRSQLNIYGYPARTKSSRCDGTTNLNAGNVQDICTGGKSEWHQADTESRFPSSFLPPRLTLLAYHYQHIATMLSTINWQVPPAIKDQALTHYDTYRSTLFKDNQSYIDFNNATMNLTTVNQYFPETVHPCNGPAHGNHFYLSPGRTMLSTGETPGEVLATINPSIAHILNSHNFTSEANIVMNDLDSIFNSFITSPLSPQHAMCAPSSLNWGQESLFRRTAWSFANLYVSNATLHQYSQPVIPKPCDLNSNGSINSQDLDILKTRFGKYGGGCVGSAKTDIFDYNYLITQMSTTPAPTPNIPIPTPITPPILPDQISWGNWTHTPNITQLGNTQINFPDSHLDSATIVKDPSNTYIYSITKGDKYWNNTTQDFSTWSGWAPSGGGSLAGLSVYPSQALPFDSRSLYYNSQNQIVETITKDSGGWFRTYTSWPNTVTSWSYVNLLDKNAFPVQSTPVDARTTYKADNNLTIDIVIKGNHLWYRSIHPSNRTSRWSKTLLSAHKLPVEAQSNINTITVAKLPNGTWQQTITKGQQAWNRIGNTTN